MLKEFSQGSSINDVTVLGDQGQGSCDGKIKAFVIKGMMIGGKIVRIGPKLRDVIYFKNKVEPSQENNFNL